MLNRRLFIAGLICLGISAPLLLPTAMKNQVDGGLLFFLGFWFLLIGASLAGLAFARTLLMRAGTSPDIATVATGSLAVAQYFILGEMGLLAVMLSVVLAFAGATLILGFVVVWWRKQGIKT
jgi:hypothetical protein